MKNNKHRFDFIWESAILPAINQCFQETMDNFILDCKVVKKDEKVLKKNLENNYLEIREKYKKYYHVDSKKGCLDLTKLAAIICFSLIKNKAFSYRYDKSTLELAKNVDYFTNNIMINYKAALYAALNITFISLLNDCYEKKSFYGNDVLNEKLYNILITRKSLKMYKYGNSSYDSFINSLIKNLAYFDINGFDFDFTSFSIILDGLKEYNKVILIKEYE